MREEKNIRLLEQAVKGHAFIRNIEVHRKPDGTLDMEGNLKLWDDGMREFEKEYLWGDSAEKNTGVDAAYFVFVPTEDGGARDTILIAHGGGFVWRTGCEGPNVAWHFHKLGYNTAILAYRLQPKYGRKECMEDMQRAIRTLRSKKEEWNLGERIIAMGFSAGAMICGNCATHYDLGNPNSEDIVEHFSSRPDAVVISYGAMSCVSFPLPFGMVADATLFGATAMERHYFAPEKYVTPETPPMFIWQTLSDDGRNGMCLAKALQDAGVPYELHIMEGGVHGLALADGENDVAADVPHIAHWTQLCDEWLQKHASEKA